MQNRHGAKRLTWDPELQFPFESGWSLFNKIKVLNNLRDHELVDLIARVPMRFRTGRLRDCADSSWIDFDRFSELLGVPAHELKNGFWDQLGITVDRPKEYELRFCKICWELHRYHCQLFDLCWVGHCPWHRYRIALPKLAFVECVNIKLARGEPEDVSFNDVLSIVHMNTRSRHLLSGHIVEYLEWWRSVQLRVPEADQLLRKLVSTSHFAKHAQHELTWQAGYARRKVPLQYGSWILRDVPLTQCSYITLTDAGRSDLCKHNQATIRDSTGVSYRAIRRHVFRRYVRRHRGCLTRLLRLSRDELLSFSTDNVCATCLAYVVWRMSMENLSVINGLSLKRDANFELRLTEPWLDSPSDDPTRLRFSYMQFFGLWATIVNSELNDGIRVSMQDTINAPLVMFAKDSKRTEGSPLRTLHCVYPSGEDLAQKSGRPCGSVWKQIPTEKACLLRTRAWLEAVTPPRKTLVEIYPPGDVASMGRLKQIWI